MSRSILRFAIVPFVVAALFGLPPAAQEPAEKGPQQPAEKGLQAVITTADDEAISARILAVAEGQLHLATEPARSVPLADVARIEVGRSAAAADSLDLIWIGQDNHDLVQVGGASGGNGVQDIHLRARNLRPAGLWQITAVCRFPKQLRVWRLDTSQSPHWRLAIARAELAPEADLYIEPAAIDSFGQKFEVTYTYNDGVTTKASVVATTHTSDQQRINRSVRAGGVTEAPAQPAAPADGAEVYLADSGRLHGEIAQMDGESLVLRTKWKAEVPIPLARLAGIWFGHSGPEGAALEFQKKLSDPAGEDVVFVETNDGALESIQAGVRGLDAEKLAVSYEGQERSISRDRVLGIVFAKHPPLAPPEGTRQQFVLASGDALVGAWVGYDDDKLQVELPWSARITIPSSEVVEIRVQGGRVTSLADLEPVAIEEVPYFGRVISWRRDEGFDGEPAKLRGKSPGRVVAMHARSVLTYALDGAYEKFKTTLGFDDSAGGRGRVDCRVLVDGREAFARQDFRGVDDPIAVEIPVAGAKQLSLEVDFGEAEDTGDRILWAEPRLFRPR